MRRRLPVDSRVERQDQLSVRPEPRDQARDVKFVRADPVERRQCTAQHMIPAMKRTGALQGPKLGKILDEADRARIALGVTADRAKIDGIEIAALRARP